MSNDSWESLDPWEKIVQWREVAPEITDEILRIAKARAVQGRKIQLEHEKQLAEAARFDRTAREDQTRRAHELAVKRLENEFNYANKTLDEQFKLANRMWWIQLIGIVGGLLLVGALVATSWQFARDGNVTSAVAIFGLGGSLTAGAFGLNLSTRKALQALLGTDATNGREPAGSETNLPTTDAETGT